MRDREGQEPLGGRRGGHQLEHSGEGGASPAVSLRGSRLLHRQSTHPDALGEDDPLSAGRDQRGEPLPVFRKGGVRKGAQRVRLDLAHHHEVAPLAAARTGDQHGPEHALRRGGLLRLRLDGDRRLGLRGRSHLQVDAAPTYVVAAGGPGYDERDR